MRRFLDCAQNLESEPLETLKACWDFIENVSDEDPERSYKFLALRERVRNLFW